MSLKSYRQIKSNRKTQGFGENKACAQVDCFGNRIVGGKVITKRSVCPIGYKDLYTLLGMKGHSGVDWYTWRGEPVYFADDFDGWMKTEVDKDGGIGVDVISNEPILYCEECKTKHYIKRRSWHGKQVVGYDGKQIKLGDMIMLADSTGASSGDHLHTSLKWCDKNGKGIHTDNGYYGAFPDLDFENVFVLDVLKVIQEAFSVIQQAEKIISILKRLIKNGY